MRPSPQRHIAMQPYRRMPECLTALIAGVMLCFSTGSVCAQAPKPPPATPDKPADKPAEAVPLNLEQEMQALLNDAQTNFNLGKYDVALQKLGAIHSKTNNKDFENVIFMEGACYYQMQQFDKAADTLQAFMTKFPKSEMAPDAALALGRAQLKKGDENKGVATLKKAAADYPARKAEAGVELANYFKGKSKPDEAIAILENITKDAQMTAEMVQGYLIMAEIYASKGETEKAAAAMEKLKSSAADDDTIIQRNLLGIKLGDEMRQKQMYREALTAYQSVRRQSEILRIQKNRIARIEQWQKQVAAGQRVFFLGHSLGKSDLDQMLDANKKILEEIEKNKNFDADLYFRLGQCFFEMKRFYEAVVALQRVYDEFKDYERRDIALYCMIASYQNLEREGKAYDLCEKYMKDFPEGEQMPQVTQLLGMLAYKSGKIDAAIKALERAKSSAKDAKVKEDLAFLLGVVTFDAGRFDDSRTYLKELLSLNKNTLYKDDAEYRIGLSYFFQNDSQKARTALREYIAGNPKGQYLVDANYRLAFVEYQAAITNQGGSLAKAREMLEKLSSDNPSDPNIGQVWLLLGDLYGRLPSTDKENFTEKALQAYMTAVDKAKTSDVLDQAMESATGLLQSEGKWKELLNIWQTYYSTHKDQPVALKAIYWISMAYRRMGQPEKSQELIAEHLSPFLGDPKNEQVEVLIQQLVGLMVPKKRKAAPKPAPAAETAAAPAADKAAGDKPATAEAKAPDAAAPAPAPAAPAAPDFAQLEEQLKKLLLPKGETGINGTVQSRVIYARALLARYMRDVAKYENLLSIIPDTAKVDELSPLLLASLGEMMQKKGQIEKATEYYNRLREVGAAGEFGDKAPVGLGQIELDNKNYKGALELFDEAITKYAGSSSILPATQGKGQCLIELGDSKNLDSAEKIFKTIFATKEWGGEAKPHALYHLGLIEERRKEWGKAIAWYQRIILAHQKYKPWLAKAYLHCAQAFINDGKNDDAKLVLRQMLERKDREGRNDLDDQPEFKQAQALLAKIGS